MVRCFLAINLSTETHDFLAASVKTWHTQYRKQVRWVRPENCHLTLKFLGEVKESLVAKIEKNVSVAASSHVPFELELSSPGVFPNPRFPRVLWIGLKGETGKLKQLQNSLETALEPLGFEPEKKGFVPHVTVGRIKARRGFMLDINDFLKSEVPPIRSSINAVNLYQSILKPSGPIYKVLSTFQLSER